MLVLSTATMRAFHADGLRILRRRILAGWAERLGSTMELAGEEGSNRILAQIDAISVEEPSLTMADLQMLADLMLVNEVNEARKR